MQEAINGIRRLGTEAKATALEVYIGLLEFAEMVMGSAVGVLAVEIEEVQQLIVQIKHQFLRLYKRALRLRSPQ